MISRFCFRVHSSHTWHSGDIGCCWTECVLSWFPTLEESSAPLSWNAEVLFLSYRLPSASFLALGMWIFLGAEWVQQTWNISSGCCQVRCVWLPITGCRWYLTGWGATCWGWGRGSDLRDDDRDKMVTFSLPLEGKACTVIFSASHASHPGASRIQAQADGWPAPPSQYSKAQVVSDNLRSRRSGVLLFLRVAGCSPYRWRAEDPKQAQIPPIPAKKGPLCARDLSWPLSKIRVYFKNL